MYVLALESSTSSAKAILYDTERGVVNSCQETYPLRLGTFGETDAKGVYEITMRMGRKAAEGKNVEAIAISSTWHGLCACDSNMEPLTPIYSWNFVKTSNICKEMRENRKLKNQIYQNTGCVPHNIYPRHAIQYLRNLGFDCNDKKFITQGGYNFWMMTGFFIESISTQSGTGVINLVSQDYDRFTLDYFNLRTDQFGSLGTYRDTKPLNKAGARLLGLKTGIPVVPAHPDGALNQVGSYAARPGIMTLSIGTSGALRVMTEKPVLPKDNQLWCYSGVEKWISGAAISGACNCINWFMKEFCGRQLTYSELEIVKDPFADEPVFLPFLYGERCPGWRDDRNAGFSKVKPEHGINDFYRAIQMGILFNLYQCYEVLCNEIGTPSQIIISGGITNSKLWLQMLSDIFKKEILVSNNQNASTMGAIALALHAAGHLDDVSNFHEDFDSADCIVPDQKMIPYYKKQYERYLDSYVNDYK